MPPIPIADHIVPQTAIHPKNIDQIMSHGKKLARNSIGISRIMMGNASIIAPVESSRLALACFSCQFSGIAAFSESTRVAWVSLPLMASAMISRLAPQERQNLASSEFGAAQPGQYIRDYLLMLSCVPSARTVGAYGRRVP